MANNPERSSRETAWTAITLAELTAEIQCDEAALTPEQLRLWHAIRVEFLKWQLRPWGDEGGGFWVVGLIGDRVLWYNDIEDGFNWSRYSQFGEIGDYWCNQDELHYSVYQLQQRLDGVPLSPKLGAPETFPMEPFK